MLRRLPEGWAGREAWSVTVHDDRTPRGFAHTQYPATRQDDRTIPTGTVVVLYPVRLDALSDAACRWVLAHEFAHVAPILPRRAVVRGHQCLYVGGRWRKSTATSERLEQLYEEHADKLAAAWGFTEEAETFSRECGVEKLP